MKLIALLLLMPALARSVLNHAARDCSQDSRL